MNSDKMQDLCYKLAHQVPTLTTEEVNYIQHHLHSYVEYMKNYIPEPHANKRKNQI
jgi:hypothetical protein